MTGLLSCNDTCFSVQLQRPVKSVNRNLRTAEPPSASQFDEVLQVPWLWSPQAIANRMATSLDYACFTSRARVIFVHTSGSAPLKTYTLRENRTVPRGGSGAPGSA